MIERLHYYTTKFIFQVTKNAIWNRIMLWTILIQFNNVTDDSNPFLWRYQLWWQLHNEFLVWIQSESLNAQNEWLRFKSNFKRNYSDPMEEIKRFKIFKKNMFEIMKHNHEKDLGFHGFTLGVNEHADMVNRVCAGFANVPLYVHVHTKFTLKLNQKEALFGLCVWMKRFDMNNSFFITGTTWDNE